MLDPPVLFWGDDRFSLKRLDVCNKIITVKAFVADDGLKPVSSACAGSRLRGGLVSK